ncbi:uncharacterized protein LOC117179443 isoform X2 [Belonocnema kinseyi]|uniref:uncharacterized protein LOC117179443 isoform X2 n=1 Tax=Belonocnema kinseyi TaxID=2817044 RepID=UPI00143DA0C1|nr:uncharacterized protein LOC117179443 isoform X2 [Belonocnema kinseyi]
MARRRKNETKTSMKSPQKFVAVRKSSRQIAKKQQQEQKVNGDAVQTSSNNSDDSKDGNEEIEELQPLETISAVQKKINIFRRSIICDNTGAESIVSLKGENDIHTKIESSILPLEKESPPDMVICLSNMNHESPGDITSNEVWSGDMMEETIICEEMDVEEMTKDVGVQQNSVVVEQVLLVNDPEFLGENLVEFTVIQNEDGTESMLMVSDMETPPKKEYESSKVFRSIEEGVGSLRMTESNSPEMKSSGRLTNDKKQLTSETKSIAQYEETQDVILSDCSFPKTSKTDFSLLNNDEGAMNVDSVPIHVAYSQADSIKVSSDTNSLRNDCEFKGSTDISRETSEEPGESTASCSMENCVKNSTVFTKKILLLTHDDETNSLDKIERLNIEDQSISNSIKENDTKNVDLDDTLDSKNNEIRYIPKSRESQEFGNEFMQKKTDRSQHIEEHSRHSEIDRKPDFEDIKLSSSSENSSDTLLSANSYKLPELGSDAKNVIGLNEAEKKSGFRSRSGSTDTTGSESGSNSSGVRRSSRIRTIGLMKQRTRGHGLVTKPNLDTSKIGLQPNLDKTSSCTPPLSQEPKDGFDNISETQLDKENVGSKITITTDNLMSLPASSGATGYDSDSSKPVKVKSRWRRSSELEMGGTGSLLVSPLGIGFGFPAVGCLPTTETATGAGVAQDMLTTNSAVNSENAGTVSSPSIMESIVNNEISMSENNTNTSLATVIPKTVGAKISLPMVLEVSDREMEERLSQFDQLNENLYLTNRYTSKESKGMLCDCFLTEDEIERGELGCGEDCLNRLLLMECGSRCVVGDRCTNKRFQNCEYAKCEVFRTEKKGFGLRSTADLEAGEFIMEYVGEVVDPKDFRKRTKEYSKDKNRHHYFMALKSDQIIDATMKGNVSRFINHSCDPNAETQKWTVNGELRIGFFNKKFIAAGEEITFDYHFQRYGKEAQKCLCEASNCRGWIGETPEDENQKIEKKETREKDITRKKKEEKKPADYMEDEDLEEEIEKLCSGGLKNRNHTLTLSRLMVRSRELEHRTRLLRVLQTGEQPCCRLFLDYHGLRLIWSYMMDVAGTETEETQQFRLEVLKTLSTLPIPNKTMLMDSKVYGVVEKWSKQSFSFPSVESPEDEQVEAKEELDIDSKEKSSEGIIKKEENEAVDEHIKDLKQESEQVLITELASNLLTEWSNLMEVFRIPKKERIEQMKEHEREADRGYKEELDKEQKRETYERYRSDRYGRVENDKRDRRRGRESPDFEHIRSKDKRVDERSNLVPVPRMTKFERRQLFALKVAKEEEKERQRRQQEELWKEHETRCLALGMDPHTTSAIDPQTGYPLFFNPAIGQWQTYPIQDGSELQQQMTPVYVGGPQPLATSSQPNLVSPLPHLLQPGLSIDISPGLQTAMYPMNQTPTYNQQTTQFPPPLPVPHQQFPESPLQIPNNLVQIHNGTPPIPIPGQTMFIEKSVEPSFQSSPVIETTKPSSQPEMPPPLDLPPKWKWAKDERGRVYYYHVKERISQWLPPPPDHIGVQPDSSTSSESSEESSSSNDEEEDVEEDRNPDRPIEEMDVDGASGAEITSKQSPLRKPEFNGTMEIRKKRDGLVQERIISPRREEDRIDHKKFKEMKEKLRRQKERARLKDYVDKGRKHRRSNKSKSHSRHGLRAQTTGVDASPNAERKIKDAFRINMANVMVHFLNPYRKNDCKQGRITNTEDFKHLARKLTHFVLAKELKHCKSVDELQCNENVKHKAKDFVRKYMSKFGAVYQKSTDDD